MEGTSRLEAMVGMVRDAALVEQDARSPESALPEDVSIHQIVCLAYLVGRWDQIVESRSMPFTKKGVKAEELQEVIATVSDSFLNGELKLELSQLFSKNRGIVSTEVIK